MSHGLTPAPAGPQCEPVNLRRTPQAVLQAVVELSHGLGYPPSLQQVADAVGLRSRSSALAHLRTLEAAGLVRRGNGPRTLSVTPAGYAVAQRVEAA